jgi:hypothetical protein
MVEYLKMIDQLLLIKASVELIEPKTQISSDLIDYIDTLLAEYHILEEQYEEDMEEQMNKPRSIH